MSRGAPALNIVGGAVEAAAAGKVDVLPFENISGIPDLAKHIGTSALPFALQGVLEGQNVETSIAGLFGARTSAQTVFEKRDAERQQVAESLGAASWDELTAKQQQEALKANPALAEATEQARKTSAERGSAIAQTQIIDQKERATAEQAAQAVDAQIASKALSGPDARAQFDTLSENLALRAEQRREAPEYQAIVSKLDKGEELTDAEQAQFDYFAIFDKPGVKTATGDLDFDAFDREMTAWESAHPGFSKEDVSPSKPLSPAHAELQQARRDLEPYWDAPDQAFGLAKKLAAKTAEGSPQRLLLQFETLGQFRDAITQTLRKAGVPETQIDSKRQTIEDSVGLGKLIEAARKVVIAQNPALILPLEKWYGAPKYLREVAAGAVEAGKK